MNALDAQRTLRQHAVSYGRIFSRRTLEKLLGYTNQNAFKASLKRLRAQRVLLKIARGAYLFEEMRDVDGRDLERAAAVLRHGEYNYISLESALSEYGAISQVPIAYLTVMTTGRKQTFKTQLGTIEFTHTEKSEACLLANTVRDPARPLRMATKELALLDLRRVGRNLSMVLEDEETD